jgi:hypothetical protein
MSRQTIRLAVVGGAVAASVLCAGTAFAADYPGPGANGGGSSPATGTSNGSGALTGASTTSSGGGTVSGGGSGSSASTGTSSGSGSLPFTGFELATALTLGVGAIGAGSVVVVASRRRRDTSAVA